jgi:hypothetical protein
VFVGQVEQGDQESCSTGRQQLVCEYPDNTKRKLRKGVEVEVRSLVSVRCCEELGVNIDPPPSRA